MGRWRDQARTWPWLVTLGAVFVFLRAPSLVEPNWYSDEGTYADIGRALLHGAALYRDVWDNKPPGVYWLAAGVTATVGPAAPAFPALLAVLVALSGVAVWVLGRRAEGRATAILATLVFIVLVSLPNLEGDLFNAELAGAAFAVWALVLLGGPDRRLRTALAAGALVAVAFLFKAVFAFDVLAALAVPFWRVRAEGRSWRAARPEVAAILAGAGAVVAVAVAVVAATGSVGGLVDVLFRQDVSYLQLTNGVGGSVLVAAGTGSRSLYTALMVVRVLVPLVLAGWMGWRWAGRGRLWAAVVAWWLGCDLAGAMVSSRGFPHYALQAAAPLALAAGGGAVSLWRRGGRARIGALAAVLAAWPVLQLALVIPRAEVAWADHRPFPGFESDSFRAYQLGEYYRLGWERIAGRISPARYETLFPTDMARQRATVALFRTYSRPGQRVFVWGTIHWSYALSDRVPAGRYVSLNSAYQVDPGAERRLLGELTAHPPAVLVVDIPLPAPVSDLLHRLDYRRLPGAAAGDDAWVAP